VRAGTPIRDHDKEDTLESSPVVLALDIGTTNTKCAVIHPSGKTVARGAAAYTTSVRGSLVEQNPDDWWDASLQAAAQAIRFLGKQECPDRSNGNSTGGKYRIAAVTSCGQMQDCILVRNGAALGPAILYSDYRSNGILPDLFQRIPEGTLVNATANLQDGSSLPAKLLWLQKNNPEVLKQAEGVLFGAHDYIAYRMTGRRLTDYTTASTTGCLELRTNRWIPGLYAALDLNTGLFPDLVPAGTVIGTVGTEFAAAVGISADIPVYQGCGDLGATAIGSGSVDSDTPSAYLGTSGWVLTTRTGDPLDPETGVFNLRFPSGGKLVQVGPMLTAAGNADWIAGIMKDAAQDSGKKSGKDTNPDAYETREKEVFETLTREAETVQPGAGGVLYLPYLAGERSPFRDPAARSCFIGIGRETTRGDLYRAVLEGVAFALRSLIEITGTSSPETASRPTLVLSGGGARSSLWPQIIADVMRCSVVVPDGQDETGLRGVAWPVMKALGISEQGARNGKIPVAVSARYTPGESSARYEPYYALFRSLYPALKPVFSGLAKIRENQ
jgi:xylulokinase